MLHSSYAIYMTSWPGNRLDNSVDPYDLSQFLLTPDLMDIGIQR